MKQLEPKSITWARVVRNGKEGVARMCGRLGSTRRRERYSKQAHLNDTARERFDEHVLGLEVAVDQVERMDIRKRREAPGKWRRLAEGDCTTQGTPVSRCTTNSAGHAHPTSGLLSLAAKGWEGQAERAPEGRRLILPRSSGAGARSSGRVAA